MCSFMCAVFLFLGSHTICLLTGLLDIYLHYTSHILLGVGVAIAIAFVPFPVTPLGVKSEGVACGVSWGVWGVSGVCGGHCNWCHLTGWGLIPPAMSLASRRRRCLLNQISSTRVICLWTLCPTTAMARCLLMKKSTIRTHFLKTKNSASVTLNCYGHQERL